jgi:hypothetical protein
VLDLVNPASAAGRRFCLAWQTNFEDHGASNAAPQVVIRYRHGTEIRDVTMRVKSKSKPSSSCWLVGVIPDQFRNLGPRSLE